MCGITGFVSKQLDQDNLKQMTDVISHRGPDAEGHYFEANDSIGLGHRRLSILDLSAHGNQPFISHDGRYIMIYNGEVYNYKVLANKFAIETRTGTDTEVILEAYVRHGVKVFSELNGMFALAIWDTQEKYLLLARDRIGIKPLFIYETKETFAFASEIKSFKAALPLQPNKSSIANFLYLGYMPQGSSLYQNVESLPAGHYSIFQNGTLDVQPYWEAAQKITEQCTPYKNLETATDELDRLLRSSIEFRMIADVPLGTFLSGGIDSSTVTAMAQQISSRPVKTFSIGFKEGKFNEASYAASVAQHLGTDHTEFILSEQDAIREISTLLDMYDEPFADSSAIPTKLVSEMARKHVTVALSGDGGDELFMGYGMYQWAKRLHRPLSKAFHNPIARLLERGPNRYKRAAQVFKWTDPNRIKSHIFSQEQYYFSHAEIEALLLDDMPKEIDIVEDIHLRRDLSPEEEQAYFDLINYLKDDLLVKVDRASMSHSLEVRVPLLDHRIVEFALNLDQTFKMRGKDSKLILKNLLYRMVPQELFDRPKWGFSIPLIKWLKTDLRYLIEDHLNPKVVDEAGLVHPRAVQELIKRFDAGEDYLYNRIWTLALLHKWYMSNA